MKKTLTKQLAYDLAVKGLASQGFERSRAVPGGSRGQTCLYRGPKGRRCGVGWVMSDEVYKEGLEGLGVLETTVYTALATEWDMDWAVVEFLGELQTAHDEGSRVVSMKRRLVKLGKEYNLTIPEELGGQPNA